MKISVRKQLQPSHDESDGMMAQDTLAFEMQIQRYRQVEPTGQEKDCVKEKTTRKLSSCPLASIVKRAGAYLPCLAGNSIRCGLISLFWREDDVPKSGSINRFDPATSALRSQTNELSLCMPVNSTALLDDSLLRSTARSSVQ